MVSARHGVLLGLMVALAACGGGGSGGESETPSTNRAPTFTSPSAISVPEETSGVFHTATASDPDGDVVSFSLSGGADQARFRITTAGGLSFATPPEFEAPGDANADNVYIVQLSASDGRAGSTLTLAVTVVDVASVSFRVRRVAVGFDQPVFLAAVPDGTGRVFVLELPGRIRILTPATGAVAALPFLDLTGQLSLDGERGLLGFAVAPNFNTTGIFYVFVTDPVGAIEVRRYRTLASDRNRADPASGDTILRILHARNNHNGGWIGFDADALLYIAVGDGGGSGDPDDNGQNTRTLLGKILRVDPTRDDFPTDPTRDYAIPAGNPFVSGIGAPEVWAYGLRNPFRNSFDSAGNLWIGDVGQGAIEEIDLMRPSDGGANFGWPILEGTRTFRGGSTVGLVPPVAEYAHGSGALQGEAVTGGYVYAGPVESLRGLYIFADFIRPNIWSVPVSRLTPGSTLPSTEFTVRNFDFSPTAGLFSNIVSFGVDEAQNLYILDFDGEIFVIEPSPTTSFASMEMEQRFQQQRARKLDLATQREVARAALQRDMCDQQRIDHHFGWAPPVDEKRCSQFRRF